MATNAEKFLGLYREYETLLRDAGIDYKEKVMSFSEWPDKKVQYIANGTLPFGQLPMLHIDGMNIVQSTSILRYLSNK